jgi:uncharacterized repeat protein (TIGR01451 family)/fimbrial isopeptide formation D2 family protein
LQLVQTQTFEPVAWPSEASFIPNKLKGNSINDPKVQDPSNGGTSPQNYVNISSATPDQSQPSSFYAFDGTTIFVRFRLEQSPNSYQLGNAYASGDPWKSAQWVLMLDLDGNGWRDLAVFLDGASGTPSTPRDRIKLIYSRSITSQSLDHTIAGSGTYLLGEIFAAKEYGTNPYGISPNVLRQYDGNGNLVTSNPWSGSPTTLDFGTTRVIDLTASGNDYFLDFQIPLALLDANPYNGPTVIGSTIMSGAFTTANSLNDPFQKDFAYIGAFCANSSRPMPGADPFTFGNNTIPKIVVMTVSAAFCPNVQLNTTILTAQRLLDCQTVVSSVVLTNFYYWFDQNQNGSADDAGESWTLIGTANPTTLGAWSFNWNTTTLPRGQYLVKVIASDSLGNTADSYDQILPQFPNIYAIINNNCGIIPATLSKSVNKSVISSNDPDSARTVIYTITISNPQSNSITLDTLIDQLPNTFTYVGDTTGGTLAPTISPANPSTGTIRWIFNPPATIPSGTSHTLKFSVRGGTSIGTYSNSVFAKSSTHVTSAVNVAPVIITNAAASISKTSSELAGIVAGQQFNYVISYQNTGTATLTNVVLVDSLVQGILGFVSGTNSPTWDPATHRVTWNLGTLTPGASGTQTITVEVSNPYSGTNPLIDIAFINASELVSRQTSNTVTNTVVGPVLSLSKSASPVNAIPGNNITYSILFGNVGTDTAHNVIIQDTLPPNLRFVVGTASPITPTIDTVMNPIRQRLTFSVGDLPEGGGNLNNTITYQATVINPYPTVGENQIQTNVAVIQSNENGPFSYPFSIYVTANPTVSFTKTSDKTVYPNGDSATFTFTLTNSGYFAAQLDTIMDLLPNGFIYGRNSGGNLSPTSSPTAGQEDTIRWLFSPAVSISPGDVKTLQFRARVSNVGVNFTNVAKANGILTSANHSTLTATIPITVAEGVEEINKSVNRSNAYQGDTLTYTLYYLNNSGSSQSRTIRDTLSSDLTYVASSETHSQGTFSQSGQILIWTLGSVANGGSVTITFKAIVNVGGTTIQNKAWISTIPKTSNIVAVSVDVPPSMTFTKSVNLTSAPPNTELTYTISYSNAPGVANSTNTVIVDTLPSNVMYVAGSSTGGGAFFSSPARIVWNLGTVAANSGGSVSFKATINGSVPLNTVITNTARLTNNEGTNTTSSVNDTVKALPNVVLTKLVNKVTAGPNDTLTYTVKYKNVGNATAESVVIRDTIPTTTTFISVSGGGSFTNGVVTWNVGTVNVNDSGSFTLIVKIPKPLLQYSISLISNKAVVSVSGIPDKNSNNALTNVIYPQPVPIKSVDSTLAFSNSIITYTINVSNSTISGSTSTLLYDSIPTNTSYVLGTTKLGNQLIADTSGTSKLVYGLPIGTVTPDSPKTVTFKVKVNSPLPNGTVISNRARVTTDKLTNILYGNTVTTTVQTAPALLIRKSASAPDSLPNSVITFTIQYGNNGSDTARSVVIADTIPTNTTFVTGSLTGTYATFEAVGNRVVISRTLLAPDDTNNIVTFQVRVASPLPQGVTNIKNITYAIASNAAPNSDSVSIPITATSTLTVDKSAPAISVLTGSPVAADTFDYLINFSVTGNARIDSAVLRDSLSVGVDFLSSELNGVDSGTVSGRLVYWSLGNLTPGTSGQATITVRVDSAGTYFNHAVMTIKGDTVGTPSDTTSTEVISPTPATITQTDSILPGQKILITVTDIDLKGTGLVFVTSTNLRTGEIETIGLPETGSSTGIFRDTTQTTFGTSANPDNNGIFAVQAGDTIRTKYIDPLSANQTPDSIFAMTKVYGGFTAILSTNPSLIAPNDSSVFSIEDHDLNHDTSSAEYYSFQIVSTTGETETFTFMETGVNTGILTFKIPTVYDTAAGTNNNGFFTVEPGDTLTLTYLDSLNALGTSGTVSTRCVIGTVDFTTSYKTVTDVNGDSVIPADTVLYRIVVKNTGTVGATIVSVVDTVPSDLTIIPTSITSGSASGQIITFTPFSLAVNDSAVRTFEVIIDSSIQSQVNVTNVARISGHGATQLVYASFTPLNRPIMIMSKTTDKATALPGDTVTYTISYANNGTSSATFVTVTDPQPNNTTYVPQSVILNGVTKTDENDGDEVTLAGTLIKIEVGIVAPGQTGLIKFKVRVN